MINCIIHLCKEAIGLLGILIHICLDMAQLLTAPAPPVITDQLKPIFHCDAKYLASGVYGARLWNQLPVNERRIDEYNAFKKVQKSKT